MTKLEIACVIEEEVKLWHGYHNNVIQRQEEDISILFSRLNYLESKQQNMTETVDRLEWLSKHRY